MNYITSYIRNSLYNFWISNLTPILYKSVLEIIPYDSYILEVGIGNGICVGKNAELIKEKRLNILGIDIDNDYLQLCNQYISKEQLTNNVIAKNQDLLTMESTKTFDYILFMESYPVISIELMKDMMKKCKKLLSINGRIIFVHNLVYSKNTLVDIIKPRMKYIPLINIDFGRLVTHDEFNVFIKESSYNIIKKEIILSKTLNDMLYLPILTESLNYNMSQYLIECSLLDNI